MMKEAFKAIGVLAFLFLPCISDAGLINDSLTTARENISTTPVPAAKMIMNVQPRELTAQTADPTQANPIGLGTAAAGGDTLGLAIALNRFSGPVDIYVLLFMPSVDPNNVYEFTSWGALQPLSTGLSPLVPNTVGPLELGIIELPKPILPQGEYLFAVMVTPAGDTSLTKFYVWITSISL